jgi:hypothetical protein
MTGQFHRQQAFLALLGLILLLGLTALACNFTSEEEESSVPVSQSNGQIVVNIISPVERSVFQIRDEVVVQAEVRDPGSGTISRVELFVDNAAQPVSRLVNPAGSTVTFRWTLPPVTGDRTLRVRAYSSDDDWREDTVQIVVLSTVPGSGTATSSSGTGLTPIAPTYDPTCRAHVEVTALNMRNAPNVETGNIITRLQSGDEPEVVGRLADSSWYQVQDVRSLNRGWISSGSGQYVTLMGNCGNIPVVSPPTTPTPIPTQTPTAGLTLPDLVAVQISGPTTVNLGENGRATASYVMVIRNAGQADSGTFRVRMVLPGGLEVFQEVSNLVPGQQIAIPDGGQTAEFTTPGMVQFFLSVDYLNSVRESDEGNNLQSITVQVLQSSGGTN